VPTVTPAARLLVLADDALARAGLMALLLEGLADRGELEVAGDAELGPDGHAAMVFFDPDVLLVDLGWDAETSSRRVAELELSAPWVALVPEVDAAASAWQAGAHAVLPRTSAPPVIVAALLAVSVGLEAAAPDFGRRMTLEAGSQEDWPRTDLTPRELEVLALLAEGLPNKSIARRLGISDHTVKFHVNAVLVKLGAQSRTEAAMRAARLGLLRL
jgi:DNA-binding NarL/FixJ family response regulator